MALAFLIIVLFFTFIQPLKYRATSELLVVQNYSQTADAYTVARSNYFLSNILAQVVYSDSFFNEVLESGYNINAAAFSSNSNKRKKQWQKLIKTKTINDTGIIAIYAYHQDKDQAFLLNQAVAETLKNKHQEYHGLGDKVTIKIIDKTYATDWPVKPNILLNILFGALIGLAAGAGFAYLFPNQEFRIRLWPKKKGAGREIAEKREYINREVAGTGNIGDVRQFGLASGAAQQKGIVKEEEDEFDIFPVSEKSREHNINMRGDIKNLLN